MNVESLRHEGEDELGFDDLTTRLRAESKQLADRYPPGELTLPGAVKRRARRRRLAFRAAAAALFVAAAGLAWNALKRPAGPPLTQQPASVVLTPTDQPPKPRQPSAPPDASDHSAPAQAILVWRFVITSPDDQGGRRVVARGVYIPERRKEVTFDELSPAQQYAVRRALGAEKQRQWQL